ncbi:hypothetical protein [Acidipropionibacterium acidipropionici]|uniref:hypothetical protein n=1 Tax=Acidipropionibacterium acidipropionici TaxID=1748 RepID=UPI0003FC3BF6|nr:hypothetical protein [Acidipropionibacterium acidipropionici]ALN14353.1 hypothetical protein ASQ49_02680 [Acidipropionibacterium acidipropionici]APZ09884.1 hypothetical protein BWX38_12270 [Acidipropionibacterium acidipropionici]
MALDLHEKARSDWLGQHRTSIYRESDQRRAQGLRWRAEDRERAESGASHSTREERRMPALPERLIKRSKGKWAWIRLLALALVTGLLVLGIWRALILAAIGYGLTVVLTTSHGRVPSTRVWGLIAAVVILGGGLVSSRFPNQLYWRLPGSDVIHAWESAGSDVTDWWIQASAAALLVVWQIRRAGWPGATTRRHGPSSAASRKRRVRPGHTAPLIPTGDLVPQVAPAATTVTAATIAPPVIHHDDEEETSPLIPQASDPTPGPDETEPGPDDERPEFDDGRPDVDDGLDDGDILEAAFTADTQKEHTS